MLRDPLGTEKKSREKYPPPPLEPYHQALAEPVALFSPALAEALGLPMPPGAFFDEEEDSTIDEVRSALMEMKVGAPPQRPPLAFNTAAARRESSPPADDPGLKAKPRKGSLTAVAPAAESPRSRVHIDYSPWVSPAPSPRELPTQQQQQLQPPPPQSDRTATSRGGRSGGGLTSGGRGGAIRRPPAAPSTASGAASQRGSAPSSPRKRSASFGGAIGSSVVLSGSKSPSSPRLSGGGGVARPGPLIPKGRSPRSEDDGAREKQPEQQPAQQRPSLHAVSLLFAPYRSPSASQACTPAQSPWQSPRAERSKEEQKEEPKHKKVEKDERIFLETADI